MTVSEYLEKVNTRFKAGISTEHSYRGDLQSLLETIVPDVLVTNEPTRISCGAPDYIITKKGIPLGYIEAKDIGKPLDSKEYIEQFNRYKNSLPNLIITDYLEFRLYVEGEFATSISLAEIRDGKVLPKQENFDGFNGLLKNFCSYTGQTIKNPSKLAKMMAGKARLLASTIERALSADETPLDEAQEAANNSIRQQFQAFKQHLIHDISEREFADIYAQTIAYGMFAARYHDPSMESFLRQEAAELIPKTNPFLRKLFQYVAGYDLDDRIKWIVEELVNIFRAADVAAILKNFGKATAQTDPIIHFYETFLSEYDPKLRKARGVWYTPEPVVNFIVRAVDDILKSEFGLADGIADTSKTTIKVKEASKATADQRSNLKYVDVEKEVHKVQILDPACGTGTFLAEITKQIHKKFEGQQGIWSQYVEDHLIPRLNGFELLMASYSMAHLKMDMLLTETGYKPKKEQRFRIYLTNSLEEYHPDTGTLFASWLSDEAGEANRVKRDTPVMVVIGNPPYSGISTNKGDWITRLIEDYKFVDGVHFNERKHWLNDDYVKFIRFGQHFIEKNGSGVLAFINPHGFLDNPTFRGMRWQLLRAFDKIYTIDLHGNSKKRERSPDGGADQNVFDIMQGVSINLFLKTGKKHSPDLGKIYHFDVYGKRDLKYDFLTNNTLSAIDFVELKPEKPFLFFIPKNDEGIAEYNSGFSVASLFPLNVTGIVTARDHFVIDFNQKELRNRIENFADLNFSDDFIRNQYFGNKKDGRYLAGDSRGWSMVEARKKIQKFNHNEIIQKIAYRLFDERYVYYNSAMVDWGREKFMFHLINKDNVAIDLCRQLVSDHYSHVFIVNQIVDDSFVSNKSRERGYVFPLYVYNDSKGQVSVEQTSLRHPNLNYDIVREIEKKIGLVFSPEKELNESEFAPIDIVDYIYAILHSPTYREKYKEFLKIDFPRIPFPENKETFLQLVKLGGELRALHLQESPKVNQLITTYPQDGTNEVTKIIYKDEQVWINDTQYFTGVPEAAWEFYIGGYQPAQKWLKDRKGRVLSFEEILHYQKIIVALVETNKVMGQIDTVIVFQ